MKINRTGFSCSRDGLKICGEEYRTQGSGLPIAIISHGFMANSRTVRQFARFFAQQEYAAFIFDFCGGCVVGGKSDGSTTDMSVLTEVEDLKAVISYAASLPHTDGDSILLMGCSQGGFVSALTAAQLNGAVRQLVLLYPALCIPDDARAGKMMFARFDPSDPPEEFFCGPMKLGRRYVTDVIGMDPYSEILPYEGDVLIVHGTKDSIVNPDYSARANETYSSRGKGSVTLRLIDKATHIFKRRHDRAAMGLIKAFLQK